MPGVLQVEALAQTGGILCINAMGSGEYDTYFLKIDNCKFKVKVMPISVQPMTIASQSVVGGRSVIIRSDITKIR